MISQQQIIDWIDNFAAVIAEKKDYLTELDAAIGDADHGINMHRGFQKVSEKLPTVIDRDIGTILKTVSMTLISTVGGASGPLYGTFFLKASAVAAHKDKLTPEELFQLLQVGLEGVMHRGKAQLEDKTMIDALSPAVDALKQSLNNNNSVVEGLQKAVDAAEEGMKKTIPLIARKGRASYLGERSMGHQDPGATSSYLLLTTLLKAVRESN